MAQTRTITITNFAGRLTRIINGDLNSGFAKFRTSYGYDPISKPMNLTWLGTSTGIDGTSDLILDGKVRYMGEVNPVAYLIGSSGKMYKVDINTSSNAQANSVIAIHSVTSGGTTFLKGASMEFFGNEQKIYVSSDTKINSINFDGSADATVGNVSNYAANVYRPLKNFLGKLYFGNGTTIAAVDASGTINSSVVGISSTVSVYSNLIPTLPNSLRIHDIEVTPKNDYLLMSASEIDYVNVSSATTPQLSYTVPANGKIFYWNGVDAGVTAATTVPANHIAALKTYLDKNLFFSQDTLGTAIGNENQKMVSLPNNRNPLPNAIGVNGNFLYWSCPEKEIFDDGTSRIINSIYYFGSLDGETPSGLYRVLRETAFLANGRVYNAPFNRVVELNSDDSNLSKSSVYTAGIGTHYYSNHGISASASVMNLRYFNFPYKGSGQTQGGVYETQTQLFSKRVGISQIRVYVEPPVANNSFQLDIIGANGSPISNGTFTYTYGDPVSQDERINFNPNVQTLFSFGIRLTNTGTANMTIKKVEIDIAEGGK